MHGKFYANLMPISSKLGRFRKRLIHIARRRLALSANDTCRNAGHSRARGNILQDDTTGSNLGLVSDMDVTQHLCANRN